MRRANVKFVLGGAIVVAALAWLGFVGFQESKSYYITVDEYFAMQEDLRGRTFKVAGDVIEGSIDRSGSALEFSIGQPGRSLRVRYVGRDTIPDTFRDGSKAVVEGKIAADGVFQASHIEAKCASKYEAEYARRST
jgi:cytochrome c-type biogenesis protein CcmE